MKSVSFCIQEGETLGVVGESGSGKTSLGLAILRLIKFKGDTFLRGTPLKILSNKKCFLIIEVFFKKYFFQFGFLDGWRGFLMAVYTGFYFFISYAKLLELKVLKIEKSPN